jgi:hypothetical protein
VKRFIFWVLVLAVLGGGALIFRDRLSSSAGDLKVGDCFEEPSGETIKEVQHHPCTEAHNSEVYFVGEYTGSGSYPTDDQFQAWEQANCIDTAFTNYTGKSVSDSSDLGFGYFAPTAAGWSKGDRSMTCFVGPIGSGTISTSYKKAP